MHISFTVPTWALIGFGTIAYPSLGAIVASFLMRSSNRRLPGFVVAAAGALWPVTAALGVVAFPLWLSTWFVSNYGDAIKRTLQGKMSQGGTVSQGNAPAGFTIGETVVMTKQFGNLVPTVYGSVRDQRGTELFVDFPSIGAHWVPMSSVRKS